MNKINLMTVLLVSLTFGACSSDDNEAMQQPPQKQSRPLTIEVTENPLIQDGEENGTTRAAITTTSTFTGFNMDYKYSSTGSDGTDPITATKGSEGKWTSEGSWPSDAVSSNAEVTWYAYTSGSFNLNGGTPYINFTVDENAATQKDLLVATASGTYSGTNGNLSFNFDHACAALRFYVKKSTNINDKTLSVSSIVLKNVVKQGKYFYGTGAWTLTDIRTNYTLLSSEQTLASDSYVLLNGSESNSYLFLIPQALTAWNSSTNPNGTYIEVVWTCTGVGTGSGTAKIPFAKNLEKGKQYNVKINLGSTALSN